MVDQFSMIRLWVYSFIIPTNIQCVGADLTTDKSIMHVCACAFVCGCVYNPDNIYIYIYIYCIDCGVTEI